ncbi:MAG: aldose 1-epimerase family protein [Firmicutes bacterium]|nr:aldose 1-epimerase family protein [Bacillota bacterium]
MQYELKNDTITAVFDSLGAELRSLKSADGTEYLWQGDPAYWAGRAPNLFPIVGRLTEGKYTYRGAVYEMNLHGFARKSEFETVEHSAGKIVFALTENEATLASYPFSFRFTVTYGLNGGTLDTIYGVENTGADELIFALGGHPGFNVPIGGEGRFEDWHLQFEPACAAATELILSPTCYMTEETKPFPLPGGRLDLEHKLFDNDAIVLADMPKSVALKSGKSKRSVTVRYDGMRYLGLWHKPLSDAPYVCIEPWMSLPAYDGRMDDLQTKRNTVRLEPGGTYTNGFSISIT